MARRAPERGKAAGEAASVELIVEALGAQGDGIAHYRGQILHLPLTVPGDRVRVRLGAAGIERTECLEPGPARIAPACPHFGVCGGCRLQHLAPEAYRHWKHGLVARALAGRGLTAATVAPLAGVGPGTRRRARLFARREPAGVRLGFRRRKSHAIAEMAGCLVLVPTLRALHPALSGLLGRLLAPGEECSLDVTELDDGIDLVIGASRVPALAAREALAAFAAEHDLARLSWRTGAGTPEPLAHRRTGIVRFAGVPVRLPPGGFLQATRAAETMLVRRTLEALPENCAHIADLYCGAGAFTFALAGRAAVMAIDSDEDALAALANAARRSAKDLRISTRALDLERSPPSPEALSAFDAVLFDPPRGGASRLAHALAKSRAPVVIAVSCNPASFARDARTLIEGGYTMGPIEPIDQFLFTPHLELIAAFRRSEPHSS